MRYCKICTHETTRHGNIIWHIKLIHVIEDKDGKNATKNSNKAVGMTPYREDRLETPGIPTYEEDRMETPVCSNGFKQQSRMSGGGIPLSEERYLSINSPERMNDIQYGGHYEKLGRHQTRMGENDDSEEDSEEDERHPATHDSEHTEEEIDDLHEKLKAKKRRLLDHVLDTIPDHLKAKAKRICDSLKCKDRLFILPSYEINIDGETFRGSNIRNFIMDALTEPQTPGCIQFKLLEQENKTLRWLLNHTVKVYERERGAPNCRKFESMFDGTVEYFDDDKDKDSDEEEDEEDGDEDSDKDEGDYEEDTSDSDDSKDVSDEDDDDDDEDDEPTPKKKKKKF